MHESLDAFAAHLADYERLSQETVNSWVRAVRQLLDYTPDAAAVSAGRLSPADFSAWLRDAEDRGLASSTRQQLWYGVSAYYRWLRFEGYDGPSPLEHVRPPRKLSAPRRDYTSDEVRSIMNLADAQALAGAPRARYDRAALATLRYTGARCGEVTGARLVDLDLKQRHLSVLGKGNRRRAIPLPRVYVGVMEDYLAEVRPGLVGAAETTALFPALVAGRGAARNGAVAGETLLTMVKRLGAAAGVRGPHTAHRWRHTYATHLLRSGVDVAVVKELLGHASITTTSIYLHLVRDDLRAGVDKAF